MLHSVGCGVLQAYWQALRAVDTACCSGSTSSIWQSFELVMVLVYIYTATHLWHGCRKHQVCQCLASRLSVLLPADVCCCSLLSIPVWGSHLTQTRMLTAYTHLTPMLSCDIGPHLGWHGPQGGGRGQPGPQRGCPTPRLSLCQRYSRGPGRIPHGPGGGRRLGQR